MEIRNEFDVEILKRAEETLDTDYKLNITDDEFRGFIYIDYVYEIIDNLCSEVDRLKEQIEDIEEKHERDIRENYKPISPYEFYGVNEGIFH